MSIEYNKVESREMIYKGWSTLYKYKLQVKDENKGLVLVDREIYDSGNGASVLLYNPDSEKVILTRQYRLAAHLNRHDDGYLIEACAGLLDDLDPLTTIKKEIYEETGIVTDEIEEVMRCYASPGAHMELITLYLARYSDDDKKGRGGGLTSEYEDIEVLEFSYDEIAHLYQQGKLEDSKTIILVQYALIKGIISIK
jgi:nudix-type nucleoside diphosphatase (YffH/AdpP family)